VVADAVLFLFARASSRHPNREKPLMASGPVAMIVGLGATALVFQRLASPGGSWSICCSVATMGRSSVGIGCHQS